MTPWREAILYQIYPRSFQDDNGDGIGDLPGIMRRLDHVASLGVDAIWISPFFPSPMADMGYDVSDYTGVDPVFGTLKDFDHLIAKAHGLGLRVVIDQVLSHSSDQHPWFIESRSSRTNRRADWYVWADPRPDGSPPNSWPSVFVGSAWQWDATRRQYYLHNFLSSQPDLNYTNPEVMEAALAAMRFWLDRGVDGFRLDTANYYVHDRRLRNNPPKPTSDGRPTENHYDMQYHVYSKNRPENVEVLRRMRALVDEYDDRVLIGEVGDNDRAIELMGEYTSGSDKLHMAYSFDMLSPEFSPQHFRGVIDRFWAGATNGWPCWSFSNHDVIRHASRWENHNAGKDAVAIQAIALLMSLRGTLCLYQGEELGQLETVLEYDELTDPVGLKNWPANKGRDGCRTPMVWDSAAPNAGFSTGKPWLPVKPPQSVRSVSAQEARTDSTLAYYRQVIAWRKSSPALRAGAMRFRRAAKGILRFTRGEGAEALDCVFNLSPKGVQLAMPAHAALVGPCRGVSVSGGKLELEQNGFCWLGSPR